MSFLCMFCEFCGSILVPGEDGFFCPQCGKKGGSVDLSQGSSSSKELFTVSEGDGDSMPKAEVECPKCDCELAFFMVKQTRAADESPTTFYTCVKCGHKWRDYD